MQINRMTEQQNNHLDDLWDNHAMTCTSARSAKAGAMQLVGDQGACHRPAITPQRYAEHLCPGHPLPSYQSWSPSRVDRASQWAAIYCGAPIKQSHPTPIACRGR